MGYWISDQNQFSELFGVPDWWQSLFTWIILGIGLFTNAYLIVWSIHLWKKRRMRIIGIGIGFNVYQFWREPHLSQFLTCRLSGYVVFLLLQEGLRREEAVLTSQIFQAIVIIPILLKITTSTHCAHVDEHVWLKMNRVDLMFSIRLFVPRCYVATRFFSFRRRNSVAIVSSLLNLGHCGRKFQHRTRLGSWRRQRSASYTSRGSFNFFLNFKTSC